MKILVLNVGSSSLKYQLFDMETEKAIAKGGCEKITSKDSFLVHNANGKKTKIVEYMADHTDAFNLVLKSLLDSEIGVIKSIDEISGVGHRCLHDGGDFDKSVVVTDEVVEICKKNEVLGPLHMPYSNACLKVCRDLMPNTPMTLTFDTSFHSTMPEKAFMYAIPYEDYKEFRIRKYGFHGTSHRYVSGVAKEFLGKENSKIITCHLGNGASMAAVLDGKCIDTTMGLTPLEGLVMGTRSGDIDPAVVETLMTKKNMTIGETINYLNKKSGMLGVSGISNDNRDLEEASKNGNARATLAFEMFSYKVTKYIGAYAAALGGVDAVVFTGGIGENSEIQRAQILEGLDFMGIKINNDLNNNLPEGAIKDISAEDATVKTLVIPTNEELVIAKDTMNLIK